MNESSSRKVSKIINSKKLKYKSIRYIYIYKKDKNHIINLTKLLKVLKLTLKKYQNTKKPFSLRNAYDKRFPQKITKTTCNKKYIYITKY